MMSAQSLGLARVVLGVPFEASERKYTAPTLMAVREPSFNSCFAATGTLIPDGTTIIGCSLLSRSPHAISISNGSDAYFEMIP